MVVASRLFLIFLSLLFISNFVSAQTLTKIDVDLKNLFKTTEVEKLENKEEILDFNEICHQKLETYLNSFGEQNKDRINACLMSLSPELEIEKLTKVLNQERLSRFTAREQIPLFAQFLKSCHDKQSEFHGTIQKFAVAAYDISFKNKEKPKSLSTPEGYSPTKFYGNVPDSCYNSGFKAAMFSPNENSDHVIFAIAGTEAENTYSDGSKRERFTVMRKSGFFGGGKLKKKVLSAKDIDKEDWSTSNGGATGTIQSRTKCAQELIDDAVRIAKEKGKKIVFTGHSLGGALSQGLSYRTKKILKDKSINTDIMSVNFMPAPGYHTVKPENRNEQIANEVLAVNYVSPGDIVSTQQNNLVVKSGPHLGEVRYMVRKKELEDAFIKGGKRINTHSLRPECYGSLGCSEHILGQEIFSRNLEYFEDLKKQKEELQLLQESNSEANTSN